MQIKNKILDFILTYYTKFNHRELKQRHTFKLQILRYLLVNILF